MLKDWDFTIKTREEWMVFELGSDDVVFEAIKRPLGSQLVTQD